MALNIQNTNLRISAGFLRQFPGDPIPQIAFSGRSNVGKSSLINTLLGRKSLTRVSKMPGKTITINFYDIDKKMYLVDLPGYGYAKRTFEDKKKWSALTDGFFTGNKNLDSLKLICQLVDSRTGPTEDDYDMLYYMREAGLPHILVATKVDKLNTTEKREFAEIIADDELTADLPLIYYSSKSNLGRDDLWKQIYASCKL